MRPVRVVVPHVDAQDTLEMSAADDQKLVETVGANGAHPAFGIRRSRSALAQAS